MAAVGDGQTGGVAGRGRPTGRDRRPAFRVPRGRSAGVHRVGVRGRHRLEVAGRGRAGRRPETGRGRGRRRRPETGRGRGRRTGGADVRPRLVLPATGTVRVRRHRGQVRAARRRRRRRRRAGDPVRRPVGMYGNGMTPEGRGERRAARVLAAVPADTVWRYRRTRSGETVRIAPQVGRQRRVRVAFFVRAYTTSTVYPRQEHQQLPFARPCAKLI